MHAFTFWIFPVNAGAIDVTRSCGEMQVFTDMPGGKQDDQEEVVITGDGLVKRCPQQQGRRGDVVEPDFGGKMQVLITNMRCSVNVFPHIPMQRVHCARAISLSRVEHSPRLLLGIGGEEWGLYTEPPYS